MLYVNGDFTVKFAGCSKDESQPLLDYLYAHASRNEFTCRFNWSEGSITTRGGLTTATDRVLARISHLMDKTSLDL